MITKTRAKEEYLLNDKILAELGSISVEKPKEKGISHLLNIVSLNRCSLGWNVKLKLYLLSHVKARAISEFGSMKMLENLKMKRMKDKMQKTTSKWQRENDKKVTLSEVISSLKTGKSLPKQTSPTGKGASSKRKSISSELFTSYHEHQFVRKRKIQEGADVIKHFKVCSSCGYTIDVEPL